MANSRYIVAGGTSGIGLEITRQLLAAGGEVMTISRNPADLNHERLSHLTHDFTSSEAIGGLFESIDGIFYCPGSITLKPINTITDDDLLKDFLLNAVGAFKLVKACKPKMNTQKNPGVVLFSSVAVATGMPYHVSVSMAKGAVEGLTHALSAELAPTIRVNCIAPSLTDTPLAAPLLNNEAKRQGNAERHPLKRIGTAEEAAELAVFIMTKATWMTGQIVNLNGGLGALIK